VEGRKLKLKQAIQNCLQDQAWNTADVKVKACVDVLIGIIRKTGTAKRTPWCVPGLPTRPGPMASPALEPRRHRVETPMNVTRLQMERPGISGRLGIRKQRSVCCGGGSGLVALDCCGRASDHRARRKRAGYHLIWVTRVGRRPIQPSAQWKSKEGVSIYQSRATAQRVIVSSPLPEKKRLCCPGYLGLGLQLGHSKFG